MVKLSAIKPSKEAKMPEMTPKQKELLRWIVTEVNAERLPEAGIRFSFPFKGSPSIENYEGDKGQISAKSLSVDVISMFEQNKYMKVRRMKNITEALEIHECTLTIDAYTATEIESQYFFPQGAPHDAYVRIKAILRHANSTITIVDPYINESILPTLASVDRPSLTVRLLTSKLPPDFGVEARKFTKQHSAISLEVRKT